MGSFVERTLGDYIGSYKGYIKDRLGKPFRGTTLGVQLWDSRYKALSSTTEIIWGIERCVMCCFGLRVSGLSG